MRPGERDLGLLWDMREACREICGFVADADWDEFIADRKLCLAVERCLEIIGEAASRVSDDLRNSHSDIEWQRMKGMRNILAHDYGAIDYEILFSTAKRHIPQLLMTLNNVLEPAD